MPLQLMNFGTTVDDIGTCGGAYTAAMLTPHDGSDLAGPAHAMASCGAPQALSFAQHLSGANLALGSCYGLLGAVFAFFVCYVTYSYVMVCCAAFVNALLSIVAAAPAMIHGHPRRRAARRIKMFFKHAALVFAYTTYISMAAMIVLKMGARGGYADQVGMTHPLARLFMIAIISVVAIGVFCWLKRELGDHTRQDFTHSISELGRRGREGYQRGQDAYDRARDLNSRAPWAKNPDPDQSDTPTNPTSPSPGRPSTAAHPAGGHPHPEARATTPRAPHPPPPPPVRARPQQAHPLPARAPLTGQWWPEKPHRRRRTRSPGRRRCRQPRHPAPAPRPQPWRPRGRRPGRPAQPLTPRRCRGTERRPTGPSTSDGPSRNHTPHPHPARQLWTRIGSSTSRRAPST